MCYIISQKNLYYYVFGRNFKISHEKNEHRQTDGRTDICMELNLWKIVYVVSWLQQIGFVINQLIEKRTPTTVIITTIHRNQNKNVIK